MKSIKALIYKGSICALKEPHPNDFVCPKCQNNKCWVMGDGLLKCTNCKEKTSITSHTIFHRTKQPLRSWFHFIWVITHSEYGNKISDLGKRFSLERKTTVEWVDRIHDIITKHLIPEKPSRTINKPLDIHVLGSKKNNVICLHTDLFITENYDQIWIDYRSNEIKEFWDYICHLDRYAAREQELYMQEPNGLRTLVTPHNYNLQLTLSLLYKQRTILEEKLKKIGAPTSLLNHTEKGILDEQLRMINESISVTGIDHNLQMTLLDLNNKKTILKKELRMIANSTSLLQSKNKKTILKKNKEITPEPEEELRKMGKWIYSLLSKDKKKFLDKIKKTTPKQNKETTLKLEEELRKIDELISVTDYEFEPQIKRSLLYIQNYELTIEFSKKNKTLYQAYLDEISFRYNYRENKRLQFDEILRCGVTE